MGFLDRIYRIWGGRVPSAGVGAVPVVASVAGVPSAIVLRGVDKSPEGFVRAIGL